MKGFLAGLRERGANLAAQVSAWRTRESIASRAGRVNWQKVDEILGRVPDVPPVPGDEL